MKNIEWLKEEVDKALRNKVDGINYYDYLDLGRSLNELINQLDRPEILSDKWIDDNSVYASFDGVTEEYVHVDDLQNLLMPKQEVLSEEWLDKNVAHVRGLGDVIEAEAVENLLLPKQEVLSEGWLEENKSSWYKLKVDGYYISVEKLQNLIVPKQEVTHEQVMEWLDNNDFYCHATAETVLENAVDKGELGYYGTKYAVVEKPVIPKLVADWIEEVKPDNSLRVAFEYIAQRKRDNYDDELAFWLEEGNSELFARAWLDGYTVEEQKYYVRDKHGVYLLAKNHQADGRVETVAEIVEFYGVEEVELDYELTEQEIKDYDPKYMAFAKPVEELEE